jgi:D-amino-acid oxidase
VDFVTAQGIFDRCAKLDPALRSPETRIISHNVGLRPGREDSSRVEVEWVELPIKGDLVPSSESSSDQDISAPRKIKVVHAYGFGYVHAIQAPNRAY